MSGTFAVYRLYYGRDWIEESIRRVAPHVEKVFVFFTGPLADDGHEWPDDPDGAKRAVLDLKRTVHNLVTWECPRDRWGHQGQFSYFINEVIGKRYGFPETILINEYDHLWVDLPAGIEEWWDAREQTLIRCAKVAQTELWRPPQSDLWWRIPDRPGRVGPIFWDTRYGQIPETVFHGIQTGFPHPRQIGESSNVLNVGYATSEATMRWKMRCALALSWQDSAPDPCWVDDVYLAWKPGDTNLEISLHHKSAIPYVTPWEGSLS